MSHCIGRFYYEGSGVAKDLVEARRWFQKASDLECTDGHFILGFMKVRGEGGPKELIAGLTLIETAASAGHTKAQELLAKYDEAQAAFNPL